MISASPHDRGSATRVICGTVTLTENGTWIKRKPAFIGNFSGHLNMKSNKYKISYNKQAVYFFEI